MTEGIFQQYLILTGILASFWFLTRFGYSRWVCWSRCGREDYNRQEVTGGVDMNASDVYAVVFGSSPFIVTFYFCVWCDWRDKVLDSRISSRYGKA